MRISLFSSSATVAGVLLLAACTPTADTGNQNESSAASTETSAMAESSARSVTPTVVSYQGTLQKAGPSIYMQGTHELTLPTGKVILLESTDVDLEDYEGRNVMVRGIVQATVEEGGTIMSVQSLTALDTPPAASSEAMSEDAASTDASEPAQQASSVAPTPTPTSSEAPAASSEQASSEEQSSSEEQQTSSVEVSGDAQFQAWVASMSNDDTSAGNWTQEYCTPHSNFCVPIHRNWWWNSFGATANYLWHVEVAPQFPENLGDGPLVINLLSGDVASAGASDGQVRTQGEFVIGFRSWTDGRHFEISAPASLEAAVRYMTANLREAE